MTGGRVDLVVVGSAVDLVGTADLMLANSLESCGESKDILVVGGADTDPQRRVMLPIDHCTPFWEKTDQTMPTMAS
jgi:hypothetical protein